MSDDHKCAICIESMQQNFKTQGSLCLVAMMRLDFVA
jgi:hypothetical protein